MDASRSGGERGRAGEIGGRSGEGGGDRWRSGEIGELEDAGAQRVWEHNACVQPTSSAVLAGAGKQGDDCVGEDSRRCSVRVEMRAGEAKSKGVPHSWTLAHLAMRHASGSAAANAWLHRGVGCGSCVLEIVVQARARLLLLASTRVRCAPITPLCARTRRFVYARSPAPFDPEFWTSVSGRVSAVRPSLRRPLEHSARSARSPRTRALALSPRALSPALSPPSRSWVSRGAPLSACGGFLS